VQGFVGNKSDEQNNGVTPGGVTFSKAMPDAKGNIDFYIQIRFVDEKKGSFYRCLPVRTNAQGKSELPFDITESSSKSVGGAGIGCR
jgi:hypothetical protein